MKILSVKDRLSMKYKDMETLEEIDFTIKPLTVAQKMEISSKMKMVAGEEVPNFSEQAFLSVKFSIADVKGLKASDDGEYKCTFDPSGNLDDDTTDDLVTFLMEKEILSDTYYAANRLLDQVKRVEVSVLPKK